MYYAGELDWDYGPIQFPTHPPNPVEPSHALTRPTDVPSIDYYPVQASAYNDEMYAADDVQAPPLSGSRASIQPCTSLATTTDTQLDNLDPIPSTQGQGDIEQVLFSGPTTNQKSRDLLFHFDSMKVTNHYRMGSVNKRAISIKNGSLTRQDFYR
ncbi:hypothetical protein EG329_006479 [Mollisiaceae sp. DMI_Dod_QoI]|nr:hypothetical protein EG329_006479 [Helotiales sp. DMI_Dod_QoI]